MKQHSITNVTLWVFITVALLLFIPADLFAPRKTAFILLDIGCISLAAGGASSYLEEAWDAVKLPIHRMLSAHYMVTAFLLGAVALGAVFFGQWIWRMEGKPDWLIDSGAILFTRWIAITALALFMLTSYSRDGVVHVGAHRRPTIVMSVTFVTLMLIWFWLG